MTESDFDVAIVGLGPVGATLANLLGPSGLKVVVIERELEIFPLPRAIHFDGEVMRVFQGLGLKAEVEAISRPGLLGMQFVNAQGDLLLMRSATTIDGPHGCANNHYFHQPQLEAVLRAGLLRFGNIKLLVGRELIAIRDCTDTVELSLAAVAGGVPNTVIRATISAQATTPQTASTQKICARYVVGCDGARSIVRREIGSELDDLGLHQPWLVFDVLLKQKVSLPDCTVQLCDPVRPMTLCKVTEQRRRWEIMLMPGDDAIDIARPESVWPLIARWITPEQAELERSAVYTFHSVIAKRWRRGRMLIAGDSAHQTPPFLGQGLCAGIRDAANLAWKLTRVLAIEAADIDALLDSYESERAPHVRAFIDLAMRLGEVIQATDPALAEQRDRRFLQGETQIFNYPSTGLGPGAHAGGTSGGAIFPQPRLADGQLLDDAIGGPRYALLGDPAVIEAARESPEFDSELRGRWHAADPVFLSAQQLGEQATQCLRLHNATVALLRPDRYLVGVASTAAELSALGRYLPLY